MSFPCKREPIVIPAKAVLQKEEWMPDRVWHDRTGLDPDLSRTLRSRCEPMYLRAIIFNLGLIRATLLRNAIVSAIVMVA